jgi:hypothetical protein
MRKTYLQELDEQYPTSKRQQSKKAAGFKRYKDGMLGKIGAASMGKRISIETVTDEELKLYLSRVSK